MLKKTAIIISSCALFLAPISQALAWGTYGQNIPHSLPDKDPNIVIRAPQGGTTWAPGSDHNITWVMNDPYLTAPSSNVDIYAVGNGQRIPVASDVPGSAGSYNWTLANSGAPLQNGNYHLSVCFSGSSDCFQNNNSFHVGQVVTPPPPPPTPPPRQVYNREQYYNEQYSFPVEYGPMGRVIYGRNPNYYPVYYPGVNYYQRR